VTSLHGGQKLPTISYGIQNLHKHWMAAPPVEWVWQGEKVLENFDVQPDI
jgi:hypothetical protein